MINRLTALHWPLAALLLLCSLAWPAQAAERVTVTYLVSDGQVPGVNLALKAVLAEQPQLRGQVQLLFITESVVAAAQREAILGTDVLVLDMMNQAMMERFNAEHGIDLIRDIAARGRVLVVGSGTVPKEFFTEQGALFDARAQAYWQHSGAANQIGLLKNALTLAGVSGLTLPEPELSLDFGYYYPGDAKRGLRGRVFADWASFDAHRRQQPGYRPGAIEVAVPFYKASYYGGETTVLDTIVREIERQGANAVPLFGYPGTVAMQRLALDEQGKPRIDVALSFLFRFADYEATRALAQLDVPLINLVTLYGRSEAEWRASTTGLSPFEGTYQVAVPELAGLIAPTVVGSREKVYDIETNLAVIAERPVAGRIPMAVARGLRYAELRRTPPAEKSVAILYYNYPSGKSNIGTSYLNVAESLSAILQRLRAEGFDTGAGDLSAEAVLAAITERARNIGGYGAGELEALVDEGDPVLVRVATYRRWLDALAPSLRAKVIADWGEPEQSTLMTVERDGARQLVIPTLRFGKILLLPQPSRAWGEDTEKMFHASKLAPHHQYVATYAWLREQAQVDAVIHLGTHGTHEWLDGKDVGLNEEDASDALIGDLPNLYVYNVDVVGEGLVARRRGMATLIDHMVPPFVTGGLYGDIAKLNEDISRYDANLHKNPELAVAYADDVRRQVIALGIAKDLGLDLDDPAGFDHDAVHTIQDHLIELRAQYIPYGLHTFGRLPPREQIDSTVEAIVSMDRSLIGEKARRLHSDMSDRIVESAQRELDSLMNALAGGFVGTGSGGEPIRNPDAYPTGKNFYGLDPEKVPTGAAWRLGSELGQQLLDNHVEKHGRYPAKVSFVIWGDETMRHEGIVESQIFYLLGTRPVWNERGQLVDVEVIPRAQLGRPRVDIVIASAAEGMFTNLTMMMDRAVQKVKMLDEADNMVRRHYLATRAVLIEQGYSEEDAERRAGVRIFDEPPGSFNLNTSTIAAASGTWETDAGLANDYMKKLGHGYGNGFWGEPMEDVFRLALAGTEQIVHSSSTMLYGALDNDDFYMYMGGLAAAVRNVDGSTPELVVTNTRDLGKPEMTTLDKFIGTEFRSRYINPEWIRGMQDEGYAGALEMQQFVEYLWGWEATVGDVIDDPMWQETFEVYVQDKHGLEMDAFFDTHSPYAFQNLSARMLETIRKEGWAPPPEVEKELLAAYLDSVEQHGVGCSEVTCGNARLLQHIIERATEFELPAEQIEQLRADAERQMGAPIAARAAAMREFSEANEQAIREREVPSHAAAAAAASAADGAPALEGYRMERIGPEPTPTAAAAAASEGATLDAPEGLQVAGAGLALLAGLLWWRSRHQRRESGVRLSRA